MKLPKRQAQLGQTVLVILLVMAVILTVGLSIVSRTVTDVKISQQSQESARAFWVAQAGLEKAIKSGSALTSSLNDVTYTVAKVTLGGGTEFVFPQRAAADETLSLWLVGHQATGEIDPSVAFHGNLNFYWGEVGSETALEVTVYYRDAGGVYGLARYPFDPLVRVPATSFASPQAGGSVAGTNFGYSSGNIDLTDVSRTYYFARLRPLYNSTRQPLGVVADSTLPDQGSCYESTATVPESGVTKKLQECQLWASVPPIFDFTLFSGGSL